MIVFYLQASYYIGLQCNVVLCIQFLPDDCVINNEKVNINFFFSFF